MLQLLKNKTLVILGVCATIFFSWFYIEYVKEPEKDRVLSIMTANMDLIHVNLTRGYVSFENPGKEDHMFFDSEKNMFDWIEQVTTEGTIPSGYKDDLQYHINQGYITAAVHADINDKGELVSPVGKIELIYDGPNWTIDSDKDTTYTVCKFPIIDTYNVSYDEFGKKSYPMYLGYGID